MLTAAPEFGGTCHAPRRPAGNRNGCRRGRSARRSHWRVRCDPARRNYRNGGTGTPSRGDQFGERQSVHDDVAATGRDRLGCASAAWAGCAATASSATATASSTTTNDRAATATGWATDHGAGQQW
jgi:hypothetical protein